MGRHPSLFCQAPVESPWPSISTSISVSPSPYSTSRINPGHRFLLIKAQKHPTAAASIMLIMNCSPAVSVPVRVFVWDGMVWYGMV